jgi:hypothetical protein
MNSLVLKHANKNHLGAINGGQTISMYATDVGAKSLNQILSSILTSPSRISRRTGHYACRIFVKL